MVWVWLLMFVGFGWCLVLLLLVWVVCFVGAGAGLASRLWVLLRCCLVVCCCVCAFAMWLVYFCLCG